MKLADTPRALEAWLKPLVDAGVDILHCSQRRFWEPEFDGSDLNFAGWAKKVTGVPTISVGSVGLTGEFIAAYGGESSRPASLDELIRRLDREEFDLVAVGRALLQDPQWLLKVRDGRTEELMAFERTAFGGVELSRAMEGPANERDENPGWPGPHRGARACVQDHHRQCGEEELLQSADDGADVGRDDASRPNGRLLGRGTLRRRPGFHGRAGYAEILRTQGREYRDQARQHRCVRAEKPLPQADRDGSAGDLFHDRHRNDAGWRHRRGGRRRPVLPDGDPSAGSRRLEAPTFAI